MFLKYDQDDAQFSSTITYERFSESESGHR